VRFGGEGRRVSLIARVFLVQGDWVYGAMDGKFYRKLIGLIWRRVIGILWFCIKE
jgi:hypothetical protein